VAVDPSSRSSGGATLGDRIRLTEHHADPNLFVRSMASRGQRGGLGAATVDIVHVLDAVGYDSIFIETMGVGQDEIDVHRVVDTTILVQVPGLGDAVQTLKAGIMEIGDVIAVNKCDLAGTATLVRDLRAMLALGTSSADEWENIVVPVSAGTGEGITELAKSIANHATYLRQGDRLIVRRRDAALAEVEMLVRADLERRASQSRDPNVTALLDEIVHRRQTPRAAAELLRIRAEPLASGQ